MTPSIASTLHTDLAVPEPIQPIRASTDDATSGFASVFNLLAASGRAVGTPPVAPLTNSGLPESTQVATSDIAVVGEGSVPSLPSPSQAGLRTPLHRNQARALVANSEPSSLLPEAVMALPANGGAQGSTAPGGLSFTPAPSGPRETASHGEPSPNVSLSSAELSAQQLADLLGMLGSAWQLQPLPHPPLLAGIALPEPEMSATGNTLHAQSDSVAALTRVVIMPKEAANAAPTIVATNALATTPHETATALSFIQPHGESAAQELPLKATPEIIAAKSEEPKSLFMQAELMLADGSSYRLSRREHAAFAEVPRHSTETLIKTETAKNAPEISTPEIMTFSATKTQQKELLSVDGKQEENKPMMAGIGFAKAQPNMPASLSDSSSTPSPTWLEGVTVMTVQQGAEMAARVPEVRLPHVAHQAVQAVMEVAEIQIAARLQAAPSAQLRMRIGSDDLSIKVQMHDGVVQTQFVTDSGDLRDALTKEWSVVRAESPDRALRFLEPVFSPTTASNIDTSGRQQQGFQQFARQHQAEQPVPMGLAARSRATTGRVESADPVSPRTVAATNSRHLSTIA